MSNDTVKVIKFVCPKCKDTRLECCEDGPYTSRVTSIDEDGDFDYGPIETNGDVTHFQCVHCGYTLRDEDGRNIIDNLEVVEWCLENCSQE